MDTVWFDCAVIGAGIAGASAAAALSAERHVALLEAEEQAGYHSTGRSAAIWVQNYGPADVRTLTGLSRAFFEAPPAGFASEPLMRRRPCLFLARPEQVTELARVLATGTGLRALPLEDARRMVPALRDGCGIQTSPAAGRFVADLVLGRDPGAAASVFGLVDPKRFTSPRSRPAVG